MKKKLLKSISLFSGAMGLDLGIEKAGFETLACIENDAKCVDTIKLNKPEIKVYAEDINKVNPVKVLSDLELRSGEVDLVIGGPPCQSFSTAGRRRSLQDFRGNVIVRFLYFVEEIKPKYFILENVRGIYSAKLANTPPEYLEYEHLEDIPGSVVYFLYKEFQKLGYTVSFNLFDSSFYGVPQKRERFIMFGVKSSDPVHVPKPTSKVNPVTLKQAISHIQTGTHNFVKLRGYHIQFLKLLKGGHYWKDLPLDLQEKAMGKAFKLSGGRTGFYRRLSWDKPSPTLVTHPAMPATMLIHPDELRPLSIQEYALIQQFPEGWKFAGKLLDIYKQIGNAVPVGLGYMIGKAVTDHYEGRHKENHYSGQTSRYKDTSDKEFIEKFEDEHIRIKPTQMSVFEYANL